MTFWNETEVNSLRIKRPHKSFQKRLLKIADELLELANRHDLYENDAFFDFHKDLMRLLGRKPGKFTL